MEAKIQKLHRGHYRRNVTAGPASYRYYFKMYS